MSDDIFRIIAKEIATGNPETGLWTRTFAECDGDADKTKAMYIRLRHAELMAARIHQTGTPPPAAQIPTDGLVALRLRVRNKLAETGKQSFYTLLGIPPDVSDKVVAAAISRLNSRAANGEVLSAELRYAMESLETPTKREQYDRGLLSSLDPPPVQMAASASAMVSEGDGVLDGFWRTRLGRFSILAIIAIVIFMSFKWITQRINRQPTQHPILSVQSNNSSNQPQRNSGPVEQSPTFSQPTTGQPVRDNREDERRRAIDEARERVLTEMAKGPVLLGGTNPGRFEAISNRNAIREHEIAQREMAIDLMAIESGVMPPSRSRRGKVAEDPISNSPQPPTILTSCDAGGCWDNVGNRYNGNAKGTMFRSDGKVCQRVGGMIQCN